MTRRGYQGIFQESGFARCHRRAAVLHFQIRLHEGWGTGPALALDTLWATFRHPSDVRVDRAGRRIPGRRRCAIRAELRNRRPHRWLCPGVASAGGGMVRAPHHLPPDRGITALWKCGKRPLRRWKTDIHGPMEKPSAFPQPANIVSHSSANMAVYTHSHSACCGEHPSYPVLSNPD